MTGNFVLEFSKHCLEGARIHTARTLVHLIYVFLLLLAEFRLLVGIEMLELLLAVEADELGALSALFGKNGRLVTDHALKYLLHAVSVV